MKKKGFLALTVALVTMFSVSTTSRAAGFPDVSGSHWAFSSISELQSCGAIGGFLDGSFRPNQAISRAEFAKMLTGLYRADADFDVAFEDVSSSAWYASSAETMAGFMPSYVETDGTIRFKPSEKLSRADAAAAVLFFFGKFDANVAFKNISQFQDADAMSDLEKLIAENALRTGIMNGKNGKFEAQGAMTRAEACTLLARVLGKRWTPVLKKNETFAQNCYHHPDGGWKDGYYISLCITDPDVPEETPNVPEETPDVPEETPNVPEETPNVPEETPDVPEETPNVPEETPNVPEETPNVPEETPNVPEETPDVPEETPDVPEETPNVPEQTPDVPEQTPDVPEETPDVPEQTPGDNIQNQSYEKQVLTLVNQERAKNGLSPLSWSDELAAVARAHSRDMAARNFFSHTNPDGQSPFDRIKAAGISYRTAGENIAAGQRTPQEVVTAWMNSAGHRANILNANYTKLGVGYVSGGGSYSTYWTQCFAG